MLSHNFQKEHEKNRIQENSAKVSSSGKVPLKGRFFEFQCEGCVIRCKIIKLLTRS